MPLQVLAVASEFYPLVKTGGLADVTGALPAALAAHGVRAATLLPGYPEVMHKIQNAAQAHVFGDLFGGRARLLAAQSGVAELFVLDAPHLYARPGGPYSDPQGRDWGDNAQRFAALGRAAAAFGRGDVARFVPDVVHGHDWQSGMAIAYLAYGGGRRPGTVFTVHNLAFQGRFDASLMGPLGLPAAAYAIDGVEYFGGIGFLKAGLQLADRITTVSPTYAQEIQTPENGHGLDGLLRYRRAALGGILNGIDTAVWDPARDPHLAARFSIKSPGRRGQNKAALQARFGLRADKAALVYGVISRLTWQKGLDLLADEIGTLLDSGAQLAVLGTGEPELERRFAELARAHPGRIGAVIGYDEALAHLIQGGADALLVPSRYEPCGLTQMCALRYGALPVVARVGGLADTVIDAGEAENEQPGATGVQFSPVTREALRGAVLRTGALWRRRDAWKRMQRNGMAADVSWERSAGRYAALYREVASLSR